MKTLLLSFTSCAIVGLSNVAAANPHSSFKQETAPIQQYSSIDSDDTQSSGASNSPEATESQKPAEPAEPATNVITQEQATAQNTTAAAPAPAPTEPQTQSPAATQPLSPPSSSAGTTNGSIPKDQNSVQNQPIDPSYDEEPVTK